MITKKRLLAQEIEAQKAKFIRQQQRNEFRQQNELSGHDDVPTSDHLEPTLKELPDPSHKAFVRDDPTRKELSEQLAKVSNAGSPDTELTLGRASKDGGNQMEQRSALSTRQAESSADGDANL